MNILKNTTLNITDDVWKLINDKYPRLVFTSKEVELIAQNAKKNILKKYYDEIDFALIEHLRNLK